MKKLTFLLVLLSFGGFVKSQTQLCNHSDSPITITYNGESLSVNDNESVFWLNAPPGNFVAYVLQQCPVGGDTSLMVKKIGFVPLVNDHGLIVFNRFDRPLPVFVTNTKNVELVLEYGPNVVFISPGACRQLPDIYVTSDLSATIILSEYRSGQIGVAEAKVVRLLIEKDRLSAVL